MIFLYSRINDETTIEIIQWLIYLKKDFIRLNYLNEIIPFLFDDLKNKDNTFLGIGEYEKKKIKISSFYFNGNSSVFPYKELTDKDLNLELEKYLESEFKSYMTFVLLQNKPRRIFGSFPFGAEINKLNLLQKAKKVGFLIPPTAIINTKLQLLQIKKEWGRIITKSINDGVNVQTDDILIHGQKTEEVTAINIQKMADRFAPSLIQKLIEKEFEVRVFYFRQEMHSIAIFSQNCSHSKIDGRYIDIKRPIRQIPFLLPQVVQNKIKALMKESDLNYGSIDLIFTKDKQFYFLEVNPYGQYGFLSSAGNYYIEKKIAKYL